MKDEQLKRLMNLTRVTGDRLVIADNETGESYVMMNLDEYEELAGVGGYEDSILDEEEPLEEIKIEEPATAFDASSNDKQVSALNEDEMLTKINRDIAEWRTAQKKKEEEIFVEEISEEAKPVQTDAPTEMASEEIVKLPSGMIPLGSVLVDEKYRKREFDDAPRVNPLEEEDLSGVPHVEEKFYLEPVE